MKKLLETLRAARYFEVGLLIVALAALGLVWMNGHPSNGAEAGTVMEQRLSHLLEQIDGAGKVSAMIAQDEDGNVVGAVIVASDLRSVRARLEIESAVQALLGIELEHIRVISGRGGQGGIV